MLAIISGLLGSLLASYLAHVVIRRHKSVRVSADGWYRLRPDAMIHGLVAGSAAMTGVFVCAWYLGSSQVFALALLTATFSFVALYYGCMYYLRTVSWRQNKIRVVIRGCKPTIYNIDDVASARYSRTFAEYHLRFASGDALRISEHLHGFDDLKKRLPPPLGEPFDVERQHR